jgi:hypothetical protein
MRAFTTRLHAALNQEINNGLWTGTPFVGFAGPLVEATFYADDSTYLVTDKFAGISRAYRAQQPFTNEYGRVWRTVRTGQTILSILSEHMIAEGQDQITLYRPEDVACIHEDNTSHPLEIFRRLDGVEPTNGEAVAVLTPKDLPVHPQEILGSDNKYLVQLAASLGIEVEV